MEAEKLMASLPLGDEAFEEEPYEEPEEFRKAREASRAALKARMDEIYAEWARPRTPEQQARMDAFAKWIREERKPLTSGPHPSTEEMIREDRDH
jgi:hypothetical protein